MDTFIQNIVAPKFVKKLPDGSKGIICAKINNNELNNILFLLFK